MQLDFIFRDFFKYRNLGIPLNAYRDQITFCVFLANCVLTALAYSVITLKGYFENIEIQSGF